MQDVQIVVAQAGIDAMIAHCIRSLPLEGCGLLVGVPDAGQVVEIVPTENVAKSARLYSVDPLQHLRADRAAEDRGLAIVGVFHSHTHTDPYPSPTDVRQAPDPSWHYVLISLRDEVPSVRSYRIVDGSISEETIVVNRQETPAHQPDNAGAGSDDPRGADGIVES